LNRSSDQRQYGSFYEGHDNLATNGGYDTIHIPPPPPLPKYEDALKLPVYVAPVIQTTPSTTSQPPPYAEISTITEIVSNAHNRNSTQNRDTQPATRTNANDERNLPRQSSLEITNDNFV